MKSSTSESKPFQSQNSRPSHAGRTAEPFQIQIPVLYCDSSLQNRRISGAASEMRYTRAERDHEREARDESNPPVTIVYALPPP